MQRFFITGTDTDAGKTYVTAQLLQWFAKQGMSTLGIKPIASGCERTPNGLRNSDALTLQQVSTLSLPYEQINPFALQEAIAPHIAAARTNKMLSVGALLQACQPALKQTADVILVEGAGGWLPPLNKTETMADFAIVLGFPIILVVGMKLGCLNHAMLTAQTMLRQKAKVAGWIANQVDPNMQAFNENLHTLIEQLPIPHLATIKYNESFSSLDILSHAKALGIAGG